MNEEKKRALISVVSMYSQDEPKLMVPQVNYWVAKELIDILIKENEELKKTISTYTSGGKI